MTTQADIHANVHWFTSSYSNDQGGNCVEGARLTDGRMAVRDSKDREGPVLLFEAGAWMSFAAAVKDGALVGDVLDA